MSNELSLKDLQLLRLIAEDGSLTAAARRMHVSQPAASQRLASVQRRLGDELFQRRDGIMRPTPVSERLVETARRIEQELDRTWQDLRHLDSERGTLRVATQCYTSYRWLPFVLREMHAAYPELGIDVLPEATESPYQALDSGQIDIALVFNPLSGFDVCEHPLFEDELFAVMHKDHPLARRRFLNPQNFEGETLVLYTGDKHAILEQVLHPAGVSPARLMQVRMTEAIVELVRAGLGIAVLSGWAFDDIDNRRDLCAVRITRAGFIRQWLAVTANADLPGHLARFIQQLRRVGEIIHQQHWRRVINRKGNLEL